MAKRLLLLIVDMQNAYQKNGVWECCNIDEVTENVLKLKDYFTDSDIIATRFITPENPIGTWKNYVYKYQDVTKDKYANELIAPLSHLTPYDKGTYSCYKDDRIKKIIDDSNSIVICGVVADCCVLATALDIIDSGKKLYYIKDAVGEYGKGSGEVVENIMNNMFLHAEVLTTDDFLNLLEFRR
jgi:nicotinamidase-related amidase